jgi:outer membrane protein assembly factor BamE
MRYLFLLLVLLCVSCGTALPTIKPYKLDVQQGNVVTSKMLLQLRPGMTKSQVRFIMGTPLIQDSFHGNRWDYVYQMREGGKLKEQRRVILDFENELLKSVRGDVVPSGTDQSKADEPEAPTGTRVVTPIKKPENKGFLNKLKFWEKDEAALAKEAAEREAAEKLAAAKAKREETKAIAKASAAKEAAEKEAAEKARREEAKAIAKASAAKQAEDISAQEEPKSILSVPIEAVAPVVEPAEVAVEAQPVEAKPGEVAAPVEQPANGESYDSSSGMQFDKKMQLETDEAKSTAKPATTQPPAENQRSGSNESPTPKDLPDEGDITYFDRLLEKIGF